MEVLNTIDIPEKVKTNAEQFIIAIGASAGGMEVIHTLFDNTATDAVSYIIIQHLSPDHKSFMAELLAKHSKLKVLLIENGMEVKPNCVYVMPEGKNMSISEGRLILKDRQGSTPNSAVDIFFSSLAEDQGDKSIAIVLSGNGADGTKGIAAIKKVGGMVIVQDPDTTEYNSMPNNAIASGYYDYILTPKLIPLQIINYVKQKCLTSHFSDPITEEDEKLLMEVINLIKIHTPLDFSEYKRATIVRRIIRRVMATNSKSIVDYIELLKSSSQEIEILSKEFLISVTKFFRDPDAFELIQKKIIPIIVENKLLTDSLKFWVIGCATGEEAYSLAILIKEHLIDIKKDMEVKIFASDIDKDALAKASRGIYPESKIKDVSEKRLKTFFLKEGSEYKVRDNIRNMIIFADHDIVHQPPYGKIDLISCRNLLIYLNPSLQKRIFSTLHFCLNIGGYLFLGPSEGIGDSKEVFEEIDKKWKIYKNMEGNYKLGYSPYVPHYVEVKKSGNTFANLKSSKIDLIDNLSEKISKSHLEETGFLAGVCIDASNKVILPFGEFKEYLLPKLFSYNLLELLPTELSIAVGTSIKRAIKENKKISVKNVKYKVSDALRSVRILAKPLIFEKDSSQQIIIIYFTEETLETNFEEIEIFNKVLHTDRYLIDLELELGEVKKKLEDANKALDESSDAIQSYNEELLSGNEEMQSSNEELQSINEELNTVNNEYQLKIKELAELNDDFNNYFKSTYNSQLYVDKNLYIRKFTPVSIKQINIKETDIGRPLADISTNIKFSHLIEDIKYVIDTQENHEKQVETTDGKWYSMMIVPYIKLVNGKSDGAIITFNDITDIKTSKRVILENNDKLMKINADHDTFIYSVSHDLKAPLHNIEGLVSSLIESNNPLEIKQTHEHLLSSVKKLKDIIDELSDVSRMDTDWDASYNINLAELLEEVKFTIKDTLDESNATIIANLEVPNINFSKKNLRSIILNLLSNAIKYRSPDRALKLNIKSKNFEDYITFSIEDNGIGISKEEIANVFSKFKRVHTIGNSIEGTGIGLYLVRKIISNAAGKIEVESELGQGSCFKVYFKT